MNSIYGQSVRIVHLMYMMGWPLVITAYARSREPDDICTIHPQQGPGYHGLDGSTSTKAVIIPSVRLSRSERLIRPSPLKHSRTGYHSFPYPTHLMIRSVYSLATGR